jgi:hypothetical protein
MMVDLLRRSLSPVPAAAWEEIDARAAQVLQSQLTARRIVDFDGPHGWDFAAVNLGRLELSEAPGPHEVPWGKRVVQALVEARVPFVLDQMELDGIARGAKDPDLEPLESAARRIALFEESAVYNGFEPGGIWDADRYETDILVRRDGETVGRVALGYAGRARVVLGKADPAGFGLVEPRRRRRRARHRLGGHHFRRRRWQRWIDLCLGAASRRQHQPGRDHPRQAEDGQPMRLSNSHAWTSPVRGCASDRPAVNWRCPMTPPNNESHIE